MAPPCHAVLTVLALALALAMTGCASLPTDVQRRASPQSGQTGVLLLPLGTHSLDARLQLIDRATQSLGLQYDVLDNDTSGHLLLSRLARC